MYEGRDMVVRYLSIIMFATILTACGDLKLTLGGSSYDFMKTEIIVGGGNIADGASEAIVVVHLKNSDSSAVPNYKPTYTVTPAQGLTTTNCSESTKDGVSACVLKSTKSGVKLFKLTNAKVGLEKSIEFHDIKRGQILALESAARINMSTSAGHRVSLTAGEMAVGKKVTTSGNYKIFMTVKTALDSQ